MMTKYVQDKFVSPRHEVDNIMYAIYKDILYIHNIYIYIYVNTRYMLKCTVYGV